MKAPPFGYVKARELGQVFDLLEQHGDEAKILAGGQSLIPSLNLRLSRPTLLIDINAIADLQGIRETADTVVVGALTTHVALEKSPIISRHVQLLAAAMPHIAHPAIRNRGTIGGSLAFADPAAELPACATALDATFILRNRDQERRVKASEFFHGLFETDLKPGEILAAIEFPKATTSHRFAFSELARRHGDYAMIGLAAASPQLGMLRLAYFGVADRPVSAERAATHLIRDGAAGVEAACASLADDLESSGDLNAGPQTKLHLAAVLLRRALPALLPSA
ncbi:FAD binding domain-containing protein [Ferrovibrio sp.]|uniref:FAD binding domain-containing protein n=1 Tax=Ferrovibrio sp. TaxID=1917215 RepID=UPI000CB5F1A5|nr:FAD binding domain-containing protein [Ferrovibrio sp.]PJI40913.1 MAG: molybdopterin dehydrogenase [Ferrovibrio sp.]